ncbi:hypothetical protein KY330_03140 [Candidatus Woesearchaeota archaeon]|nr:hypothetical protein [Candidatus Woesearchaeota archaeon]
MIDGAYDGTDDYIHGEGTHIFPWKESRLVTTYFNDSRLIIVDGFLIDELYKPNTSRIKDVWPFLKDQGFKPFWEISDVIDEISTDILHKAGEQGLKIRTLRVAGVEKF